MITFAFAFSYAFFLIGGICLFLIQRCSIHCVLLIKQHCKTIIVGPIVNSGSFLSSLVGC